MSTLEEVAAEWSAEEAHEAAKTAAKVEAMAPQEEAAQQPAQVDPSMVALSEGVWTVVDRLVIGWSGHDFALTPAERSQLAAPTAALLAKWLPDLISKYAATPEGVLLATVALVYGPKAGAAFLRPAQSTAEPQPQVSAQ